jgi:hypothetical protein
MQTFLPYSDFKESAKCLDYRRLGKQRVEGFQILKALENKKNKNSAPKGWINHPATKMWEGYEDALKCYVNACIEEWVARGYNNTMSLYIATCAPEMPWWHGKHELHSSHRAALLYKDLNYYQQFNWEEAPGLNYWWPSNQAMI